MGMSPEHYVRIQGSGEKDSRRLVPWQGSGG